MSSDRDGDTLKTEKLTIFQTSLALVAANIGGGILGMPFALYHLGLYAGLAACLVLAFLNHYSNMMYLKVKDMTPRRNESIYEIAYLLIGRPSIFFVCIVMFLSNYGCCLMYYMVIGQTIYSLILQSLIDTNAETT